MRDDGTWAAVVEADGTTAGAWIPFVRVDDLDGSTARARELGARSSPVRQAARRGRP